MAGPVRVTFEPPPGVVSNETIYSIPGAWADAINVRFVDGKAETLGGYEALFPTALTGTCRNAFNWTNVLGDWNIAFGTHSKLYVFTSDVLSDITPSGLSTGASSNGASNRAWGSGTWGSGTWGTPLSSTRLRTWSLAPWGQTLLASPRFGTLYQWANDPGIHAAGITQAPDSITIMRVAAKQRICIAFGCSEELSGNFNPLCVRWSDTEDLTDWTTSSSNNAGEYILNGGGQIVAAEQVAGAFGIWTDKSLHQMFYSGGTDIFQFDLIDENCGAIGPNAVATLNGVAYWVGKDKRIRGWAGYGTKPVILESPIWRDFADNIVDAQAEKIILSSNTRFGEIWIFYPDGRDGTENSRAIFFKVTPEVLVWSKSDFARTAYCDAGVLTYPAGVDPDGAVFNHEKGTQANGDDLSWSLRSAAQYLDEAERVLQVQTFTPDFKGQEDAISMTLHTRARPQSISVTKGPYAIAPNSSKVDFRASGAIAEIAFEGTSYVRFGKPSFDTEVCGRR